jgi:hypothetical protein
MPPFSPAQEGQPQPADQRKKRWIRGSVPLVLLAFRW